MGCPGRRRRARSGAGRTGWDRHLRARGGQRRIDHRRRRGGVCRLGDLDLPGLRRGHGSSGGAHLGRQRRASFRLYTRAAEPQHARRADHTEGKRYRNHRGGPSSLARRRRRGRYGGVGRPAGLAQRCQVRGQGTGHGLGGARLQTGLERKRLPSRGPLRTGDDRRPRGALRLRGAWLPSGRLGTCPSPEARVDQLMKLAPEWPAGTPLRSPRPGRRSSGPAWDAALHGSSPRRARTGCPPPVPIFLRGRAPPG